MAAFWLCELAPAEMSGSDALNRSEVAEQNTVTRGESSSFERVLAGPRVLRVLVVDDEHDSTDGLVWLVSRWGHAARLAYNGVEGLKVAAAQHPDVVLLDISMPGMNGFEVARQLRLDAPRDACFIIAVTGRGDDGCRQKCQAADIDMVLMKPVESSLIKSILKRAHEHVNRPQTGQHVAALSAAEFAQQAAAVAAAAESGRAWLASAAGRAQQPE
jgi:CheY-like chemotaxis protein